MTDSLTPPNSSLLVDHVEPDAANADRWRFQPYTFDNASADAKRVGAGYSTGFEELDGQDFRFLPGKLYAVIGRPGDGKTALMLEMVARHVAWLRDRPQFGPAVYVSFEETLLAVYLRLIRREIGRAAADKGRPLPIVPRRVFDLWLQNKQAGELEGHSDYIYNAQTIVDRDIREGRLVIVDGDGEIGTVYKLIQYLRAGGRERTPSLVCLDYFQKIRPAEGARYRSGQETLQDTADLLRRYAKGEDFGLEEIEPGAEVPLLLGSQVNRDAVSSSSQKPDVEPEPPDLHHIRGGDDLANDASGVLTLCRPTENSMRLRVAKNRDGTRGHLFSLVFHGATGHVRPGTKETSNVWGAGL